MTQLEGTVLRLADALDTVQVKNSHFPYDRRFDGLNLRPSSLLFHDC
jgi:hypothetical protein